MRIDESRVFVFQFDTSDMGGVTFPMRAAGREEAAHSLQQCLSRMQAELAMEFPKVSKGTSTPATGSTNEVQVGQGAAGLADILSERIDTLMESLSGGNLLAEAKAKTIKLWTDLDFEEKNFAGIITELELIASGQKKIPAKDKKK